MSAGRSSGPGPGPGPGGSQGTPATPKGAQSVFATPARRPALRTKKLSLLGFDRSHGPDYDPDAPTLDEEMEKVFAMGSSDKFSLARLSVSGPPSASSPAPEPDAAPAFGAHDDGYDAAVAGPGPAARRFQEEDLSFRRKSYQHTHSPLKPMRLHSRSRSGSGSMRRQLASSSASSPRPSISESGDSLTASAPSTATPSEDAAAAREHPLATLPRDALLGERDPLSPSASLQSQHSRESQGSVDTETTLPAGSLKDEVVDDDPDFELERRDSVSEALLSERAAMYQDLGSPDALKRVQFHIGGIAEEQAGARTDEEDNGVDSTPEHRDPASASATDPDAASTPQASSPKDDRRSKRKQRHHHHHHHHHHHRFRKFSLQEDLEWRKRSGAEFPASQQAERRRASVHPEEAATLHEMDLEKLTSHRFDDVKGMRRFKILHQGSPAGHGNAQPHAALPGDRLGFGKRVFDHTPHEVFVQLDELCGEGEDREWKETARWIKYEEHVEEGADRWGRPHVASLSFHSLLNLRRCLETGVVMLDCEEHDLPGVAYRVVEQMVISELIRPKDRVTVMRALLLRHRHVNEHERFRFGMKKASVSYTSLQNLHDDKKPRIIPSQTNINSAVKDGCNNSSNHSDGKHKDSLVIDMKEETTYSSSTEDLNRKGTNETIFKRIPVGAEATTVLVGSVDFLEQPTIAFVRLSEGALMPTITEVSIPVRFVFILLGPINADMDYHEIGRSLSTLMANKQFHQIAYKAEHRTELLSAINDFLDCSIVLPPGDWERQDLIPFDDIKAKSDAIRRRKTNKYLETDDAQKALLELAAKKALRPDPLRRTKRPWGGLVNDLKRRYPYYWSDFKDGMNLQTIAAAIFMYFAALSASITFGGLMADKTQNMIGISETLVATSVAGVMFALMSGQPLVIVGATGPLLLFDESLFNMCTAYGIEYLTMRVYIGIWLFIIAFLVSCVEGSVFVKVFTRFTEEIFASLICIIYIVESVMKLFKIYEIHPLMSLDDYCEGSGKYVFGTWAGAENATGSHDYEDAFAGAKAVVMNTNVSVAKGYPSVREGPVKNQPNTALFCTILALGTFFIAYYLRRFRNSKFLGRSARRALGDFGVPIAIIAMVLLDYLIPGTYTEKLKVPAGLSPTNPDIRGWIISPVGREGPIAWWVMFACAVPALLIYILLFMETHISELIIDKEERKLQKGSGFHLDIVLICILNMGCGFMGAPWVCAATVRSVAHVSAVTVMSRTHAPGDKPHIIEVKEQRLSSLLVATMVGLSVLMSPLLRLVPMSVLFGVFLYMGISSIAGIQFFDRLKLFFMPVKHHTSISYVRRVATAKMHLYTLIQLLCLVALWVVKSTQLSLAFPFFLLLMVPLRAQLSRVFTPIELRALDSSKPDDDDDEPDFYAEAPLPV
ncbi:anion exchange protein 2 isoform X2 [Thrips palmi]|uniref:Anion exchange protein n=1 Tax=Thrips palmi TaxID=161013 RepID=A0A6P9AEU6_THRPL|nr:anion exchange protein 2 isoform X2 [Thrips palmi]